MMKLHAVALCLIGTLAASAAPADELRHTSSTTTVSTFTYTEEYPYFREVLYPDLPTVREIGEKVAMFNEHNRKHAAELRALADRSRTGGYTNIAEVYTFMAKDHDRGAQTATNWLVNCGCPVPAEPTVTLASDITPRTSIEQQIDMHMKAYDDATKALETEKSFTVRGLYLMQMATSARHISILRELGHDTSIGRKELSARLQGMMDTTTITTASSYNEWIERVVTEDQEYFASLQPTPIIVAEQPAIEEPAPTERVVTREVIVEKQVDRIIEKPVYIERIVERPAPSTTRVAGRRQTVRHRRAAK